MSAEPEHEQVKRRLEVAEYDVAWLREALRKVAIDGSPLARAAFANYEAICRGRRPGTGSNG